VDYRVDAEYAPRHDAISQESNRWKVAEIRLGGVMAHHTHRITFFAAIFAGLMIFSLFSLPARAQTKAPAAELKITGEVSTPLALTSSDLKNMPRKTLKVVNPHDKKTEVYEGVALEELLRRAGVPQGEKLRGAAMANYVIAQATDGYSVVFSLAELDSGIADADVLVADTMDGAPLGANVGPFRIVAPHEKRPARWVRMLKSITVVRASVQ
jgi:DMSO/TMAO reductase YedYZ molybdopterin-dependent catalytic subunit